MPATPARRLAAAGCAVLLCAFAQAQQPAGPAKAGTEPPAIERLVAGEAVRFLSHGDAAVRGEAALLVAREGSPRQHDALLQIARDRDETARLYGILSLGLLGTPSAGQALRELVDTPQERAEVSGVAAAFAIGLLPTDQASSRVPELLAGFLRGSTKRQQDALTALMLALQQHQVPSAAPALRRLFDDDSTRDPAVHARLLHLLLPIDPTFSPGQLARLLERGTPAEQAAVLTHCGNDTTAGATGFQDLFVHLAQRSPDAAVRAAALTTMARRRLPQALDIAVDALATTDPHELTAAVQAVLRLGGASMCRLLERHVLETIAPARKEALLTAYAAPPSPTLLDHCSQLAADRNQEFGVRRAAALLLGHAEPTRAAPMLRDLLREDRDAAGQRAIAMALLRAPGSAPALARLLAPGETLRSQPTAWHALLAANHPEAEHALLRLLRDPAATPGELAVALRAWRCHVAIAIEPALARQLPARLARILENAP